MNNLKDIWLNIDDVAVLTGELKETVRRKCKRGEYISTFTKDGRFKIYKIKLSSLPMQFQDKYFNKEEAKLDLSKISCLIVPIKASFVPTS